MVKIGANFLSKYQRTRTLNKLIVVFSVAVFIPILIIHFFYFPSLTRITAEFINKEITGTGEKVTDYMNANLSEILNISSALNSQKYTWSNSSKTRALTAQAKNLISSLASQSSTLEKMFLYTGSSFISDTGTISEDYFMNELYSLSGIGRQDFFELIGHLNSPVFLSPMVLRPGIYPITGTAENRVVPLFVPGPDNKTAYLFYISCDKVNAKLGTIVSENFRYAIGTEDAPFLFTNLEGPDRDTTVESLKSSYTVSSADLKYMGLSLMILFDAQSMNRELAATQLANTLFILVFFLLYLFALIFFIRKNYHPIVSLLDMLDTGKVTSKNEFDLIKQSINRLQDANSDLSLKINQYQADYKNTLLYQILSDRISLMNNISDIEEWLEIPLNDRLLYAGFIYFKNCGGAAGVWSYLEQLNSVSYKPLDIAITPYFEKHCLFFLLPVSPEEADAKLLLEENVLNKISALSPLIVLSEPSSSIFELKNRVNSCILNLQALTGGSLPSGVYTEQDISSAMEESSKYPNSLIMELNRAIIRNDPAKIMQVSEAVTCFFCHAPPASARMVFSQVLYILLQNDLEAEMEPIYERINDITAKEMAQIVERFTARLILLKSKELSENSFEHILDYIDENYLTGNFSIKSLAEKYHMQVSNISAAFKKRFGINFQEYVGKLKIDKAKQLLLTSNMDIEEISNLLNYSNSSSFGRAFKKVVGHTPGEFRLITRIQKDEAQ